MNEGYREYLQSSNEKAITKYKNPIPSVDDEYVSKKYCISFTFEEGVTLDEAVHGINELIAEINGKIPTEWVRMGEPKSIRYALPQNK